MGVRLGRAAAGRYTLRQGEHPHTLGLAAECDRSVHYRILWIAAAAATTASPSAPDLLQDLHRRKGLWGHLHLPQLHMPRRTRLCLQRLVADRNKVP